MQHKVALKLFTREPCSVRLHSGNASFAGTTYTNRDRKAKIIAAIAPRYLIREMKLTLPVLFGDVWLRFPVKVQRMLVTLRS